MLRGAIIIQIAGDLCAILCGRVTSARDTLSRYIYIGSFIISAARRYYPHALSVTHVADIKRLAHFSFGEPSRQRVQTGTKFRKNLGEPFGESYDLAISPACLDSILFSNRSLASPSLLLSHPFSFSLSLDLYLAPSPSGQPAELSALKINLCFQKETGAGRRFITKSFAAPF